MNIHFENPLGLAADFERNTEAIKGLRKSGFGFIEVGTVTSSSQKDVPDNVVKLLSTDKVSCFNFVLTGEISQSKNFLGVKMWNVDI
uniref:DHO_dh domain-containing protein n=1 Tax=Loa loa TaxID=7209 RepID=A0A1I7VYN2_LOALO